MNSFHRLFNSCITALISETHPYSFKEVVLKHVLEHYSPSFFSWGGTKELWSPPLTDIECYSLALSEFDLVVDQVGQIGEFEAEVGFLCLPRFSGMLNVLEVDSFVVEDVAVDSCIYGASNIIISESRSCVCFCHENLICGGKLF